MKVYDRILDQFITSFEAWAEPAHLFFNFGRVATGVAVILLFRSLYVSVTSGIDIQAISALLTGFKS